MVENDIRERMVDLMEAHPEGMTILSIAEGLKINRNTVTKYIYELSGACIIIQRKVGSAKLCFLARPQTAKAMIKARKEAKVPTFLPIMALIPLILLSMTAQPALAVNNQSHPMSELTPIDANLDMMQYSLLNLTWMNITNVNASNQICVGGVCRTSWPVGTVTSVNLTVPGELTVSGGPVTGSGTLAAAWNSQNANLVFASPSGGSGTPSFRSLAAVDIPSLDTSKLTSGTLGNARLDSKVYLINSTGLNAANITAGTISDARLDGKLYYINSTGLLAANITTGTISDARLDSNIGFLNNTQTWTGTNTVNALTLGGNMNANAKSITGAVWANTTNLNASSKVYGSSLCIGSDCRTSWLSAGGNTSAEIISAVNGTGNGFYNLTSWFTFYVNNVTERTLFTNTYNATYNAMMGHNTSAEINAAINSTFTGQLGHNTTAEIRAAQTINTSAEVLAIAVSRTDWTTHDSYPAACAAGQVASAVGDTLTCVGLATGNNMTGAGTAGYLTKWANGTAVNASGIFEKAGNMGIGTQTPNSKLDVAGNLEISSGSTGAATGFVMRLSGSSGVVQTGDSLYLDIDDDSSGTTSAMAVRSNDGSSTLLIVNESGNVGIGTAAPVKTLDVVGDINATAQLFLPLSGSSGGIVMGGDTNLYRVGANQLKTDDSLIVAGTWMNGTNVNASTQICLGNVCRSAWLTTGNTSAEINAAINSTFTGQLGHNTTAEIRAAQTINTTAEVRTAQTINTTNEVFAAVNNNTFHKYSSTMNISNISVPTNCASNNYVYGLSSGVWQCAADLFNTTAQIQAAQLTNTSAQIITAVNGTNNGFYNLTSWYTYYVSNATERTLFTNTYNASYMTNTYNASYDSQLGHNTSAEVNAALNSTFTGQLGKNTTAEVRVAIYSTTMNLSNITNPTDCPNAQYVYGKSGALWVCRADLFNTTAQIQAAQLTNTSAQIITAVNTTNNGFYNLTSWYTYYVNNATERTLLTNTYNATYNAMMGHNTSAEINAAINSTFTGQLGHNTTNEIFAAVNNNTFQTGSELFNTTAEVQAAQTINTSAEVLAIAVSRADWTTHDSYPAACGVGQVASAVGDTLTCVDIPIGNMTGGGAEGYVPLWQNSSQLNTSVMRQFGANISVGGSSANATLHVYKQSPAANTPVFQVSTSDSANRFTVDEDGDVTAAGTLDTTGDVIVSGGDVYQDSGDLRVAAEDNLVLAIDYDNTDANTRALYITKNGQVSGPAVGNLIMVVNESGKIGMGIGITNATQKTLDVVGDINATGSLFAANWTNSSYVNVSNQLCLGDVCNSAWPSGNIGNMTGVGTAGYITKWANGTAVNASGVFELAGSVGIGTASPDSKLDVNGILEVGSGTRGAQLISTAADNFILMSQTNTPNTNWNIGTGNGAGSLDTTKPYITSNGYISLMSGNVGIGTTNPQQNLDVVGNINATGDLYAAGNDVIVGGDTYVSRNSAKEMALKATAGVIIRENPTEPEAGLLYFGSSKDTNLYRSAANVLKTDDSLTVSGSYLTVSSGTILFPDIATSGAFAIRTKVTGDADYRYGVAADGKTMWGDGTNAWDTNLYRSAADTLKTDDSLIVAGTALVGNIAATNITSGTLGNDHLDGKIYLINQTGGLNAANITTGTISDARLDTNVGFLNNTQTWAGTNTVNALTLGGNMNANSKSITGAVWANATNLNASSKVYGSSLCIGTDCRTSWPANAGNTSEEVNAALNSTFTGQLGKNTTEEIQDAAWNVLGGTQTLISVAYNDAGNAVNFVVTPTGNTTVQIQAAQTVNTTAQVRAAQTINTSAEVLAIAVSRIDWTSHDSYPAACGAGQTVSAVGDTLTCVNLPDSSVVGNVTGTGTAGYVPLWYNGTALNSSALFQKAGKLGIGTTAPVKTFDVVGDINATGQLFLPLSGSTGGIVMGGDANLYRVGANQLKTDDSFIAAGTWMNGTSINASNQICLGNVCRSVWLSTGNTSAEINAAINSTFTGQLGHNTTNEIFAAVNNNTFQTGTELFNTTAQVRSAQTINTTAEVRAAQTINTSAEVLAIAVSRTDWTTHDSYPATCAAGQAVRTIGDTLTCVNLPIGNMTGGGSQGYAAIWQNSSQVNASSAIFEKAGNVGIGTTSPRAKLDVNGAIMPAFAGSTLAGKESGLIWQSAADTNSAFGFVVGSGVFYQGDANQGNANFGVKQGTAVGEAGATLFQVDTVDGTAYFAGDVGIGTTAPVQDLDVVGDINATAQLFLPLSGSTGGIIMGGDANLYRSAANTLKTDDSMIVGGTWLNATGSLNVTSNAYFGSVGINMTSAPTRKLHLAGGNISLSNDTVPRSDIYWDAPNNRLVILVA
jgi:hypothetical protein